MSPQPKPVVVEPAGADAHPNEAAAAIGGAAEEARSVRPAPLDGAVRLSIIGLFAIAAIASMQAASTIVVPFVLALLLFLTFRPIVRGGARRGVPAALTAAAIVISLVIGVAGVFYTLSGPVTEAADNAPEIVEQVQQRLAGVRERMDGLIAQAPEEGADDAPVVQRADLDGDAEPEVVVQAERGTGGTTSFAVTVAQAVAINVAGVLSTLLITLVLLFFLLASGSLFYEKLVQSFKRLEDKKQALFTVHQVERDISRYLLTISVINWGLGVAVSGAMWLLGMPNPLLWLVVAAVFNYLPYAGAIAGTVAAFLVALLTFDSFGQALLVPIVYYALTTFEGSVVTPYFVGRRLQINTVSVFVFVAFAFWVLGIWGALMAVPILVVVKEICENVPGGENIANFLSARPDTPPTDKAGGIPSDQNA